MPTDDENYTELEETVLSSDPPDWPPNQRRFRRAMIAVSVALAVSGLVVIVGVELSHGAGTQRAFGPTPSPTFSLGTPIASASMTSGVDVQQRSAPPSSSASSSAASALPSTSIPATSSSLQDGPVGSAPPSNGRQPTAATHDGGPGPVRSRPGRGTTSPRPSVAASTPAGHAEEAYNKHGVPTFSNYSNASGQGPSIPFEQSVQVVCKVYNTSIPSVLPGGYWYKIATAPWTNLYAAANTFLNGDPPGGPYTHNFDVNVPSC